MAQLIPVYGDIEKIHYEGNEIALERLQELVGGYIQIVYLDNGQMLVMNEDAKPINPKNEWATRLASKFIFAGDYVAGPAVLLEQGEIS